MSSSSSSQHVSPGTMFFWSRVFPLIFIVAGALPVFFGVRDIIRAQASADWPTAEGTVVASSVERDLGMESDDDIKFRATVLYEFSVDGTTYNGDRVAYGDYGSGSPAPARRIVNRYPEGKAVTIYYRPGDPEECLLEPGVTGQPFFLAGLGLIFVAIGGLMAVFLPRAIRSGNVTFDDDDDDLTFEEF